VQKYTDMFQRRAGKGQCVNQPYLGCREFAADFRLVESAHDEPEPEQGVNGDLGWMLYDLDYSDRTDPKPMWFRAQAVRGVIDLVKCEVRK
jgi:CRISPR-associated protein Cas5d